MKIEIPLDHETPSFATLLPALLREGPLRPLGRLLMRVSGLEGFEQLVERARAHRNGESMSEAVLEENDIRWRWTNPGDVVIPRSGPTLIVANHAFGVADGLTLHTIARLHRPEAKTVANYALRYVPEVLDELIFVDPIVDAARRRQNAPALRETVRLLIDGGAIAMFPAGAMMRWIPRARRFTDPPWSRTLGGLARLSRATIVPLFFHGRNRLRFDIANAVSRDAGLALMLAEFLAQRGRELLVTAGCPIGFDELDGLDDATITARARAATFALASAGGRARGL